MAPRRRLRRAMAVHLYLFLNKFRSSYALPLSVKFKQSNATLGLLKKKAYEISYNIEPMPNFTLTKMILKITV